MRRPGGIFAGVSLAAILLAVVAGFLPVLVSGFAQGTLTADPYLLRVVRFTLLQAALSTVLSILIAIPVARALARQRFPGRTFILRLFMVPLALPAIVVILGIVEVYGAGGWLGGAFDLYGLAGILIAHVFFNFPLAARLLLSRIEAIPTESFRLAAGLGFRGRHVFRLIEWPQIAAALPGIATLIFLLCTASFAVVLTLGGGPQATTLEVAIYQSLRFDFDPARATALSIVQILICCVLAVLAGRLMGVTEVTAPLRRQRIRYDGTSNAARLADGASLGVGLLILLPPIAAVVISGVSGLPSVTGAAPALLASLGLAAAAAMVSVAMIWPIAVRSARSSRFATLSNLATLGAYMVPPAVLATGWFILFSRHAGSAALTPLLVAAMNALMALPFVYGVLAPAIAESAALHDRLCAGLGLRGFDRLRVVDLPSLKRPLALAVIMAVIVSLGDLTAITLFGSQDLVTLPSLIYRQMGSYRMEDAAGTALILAGLTLVLIVITERLGAHHDPA